MFIKAIKTLRNNKFSKIILHENLYYIFGIESKEVTEYVNKYILFFDKYDMAFSFIERRYIQNDYEKSTLIKDILIENEYYVFLIEQKSIDVNKHFTSNFKYYIHKNNLETFIVEKNEPLILENNLLISKIKDELIIASKIEIDEDRPDYYWGKYLFCFQKGDGKTYVPVFDNIVNYKKDKGHLMHYIEKNPQANSYKWDFDNNGNIVIHKYFCMFSIRHVNEDDETKYNYQLYFAYTDDFHYFYNTSPIKIINTLTESNWYCYPEIFKRDGKYYVLMNQDDFGQKRETLLCEITGMIFPTT